MPRLETVTIKIDGDDETNIDPAAIIEKEAEEEKRREQSVLKATTKVATDAKTERKETKQEKEKDEDQKDSNSPKKKELKTPPKSNKKSVATKKGANQKGQTSISSFFKARPSSNNKKSPSSSTASKFKNRIQQSPEPASLKQAVRDIVLGKVLPEDLDDKNIKTLPVDFRKHMKKGQLYPQGIRVPTLGDDLERFAQKRKDGNKKPPAEEPSKEPIVVDLQEVMDNTNDTTMTLLADSIDENDSPTEIKGTAEEAKNETDNRTKESNHDNQDENEVVVISQVISHDKPKASPRKRKSEEQDTAKSQTERDADSQELLGDDVDATSTAKRRKTDNSSFDKQNTPEKVETTVPPNKAEKGPDRTASNDKSTTKTKPEPSTPDCAHTLDSIKKKRARFLKRYNELVDMATKEIPEEDFTIPHMAPIELSNDTAKDADFPSDLVPHLVCLVQESKLTLSEVAKLAFDHLRDFCPNLSLDVTTEKIRVLFTREQYLVSLDNEDSKNSDENENPQLLWRFEVTTTDFLPDTIAAKVKKARTARRKVRNHARLLVALITNLDKLAGLLSQPDDQNSSINSLSAKVAVQEERVFKMERDMEKARRTLEVKKQREQQRRQRELEKLKQKEIRLKEKEEKQKEKENERQRKKEQAARIKEEKRREREEKEAEEKAKAEAEKQVKLEKQKAFMRSFFGGPKVKTEKPKNAPSKGTSDEEHTSDAFWSTINRGNKLQPLFADLTRRAKESRKRKSKMIPVKVYVAVNSGNIFGGPSYVEPRTVTVNNKKKFLSFFEDCRPAYFGTWSKKSSIVTGRAPFGKDTQFLNYNVDSEAEWEEGDDEVGEDLEDLAADGEEENECPEGDTRKYNFEDGWLAQEDDIVYENQDDEIDSETLFLRQKRKIVDETSEQQDSTTLLQANVCIVSPAPGGMPLRVAMESDDKMDTKHFVEGSLSPNQALDLAYMSTEAEVLSTQEVCMDLFPPSLTEEGNIGSDGPKLPANQQEMSREQIKVFCEFIHHCTLPSKESLIEAFRTKHPTASNSRAQATRKLDTLAGKRKNPVGGVIWLVKEEWLRDLGLEAQLAMKLPEARPKPTKKSKKGGDAKSPDKDTPTKKPQKTDQSVSTKGNDGNQKKKKDASSESKKKGSKTPGKRSLAASAALMESFFKKKQKT